MAADDVAARVKTALVDWLEGQRVRFLVAAERSGVEVQIRIPEPVCDVKDETSFSTRFVVVGVSPLCVPDALRALRDALKEDEPGASPALILHSEYGARCETFPTFRSVASFAHEPVRWIDDNLLFPVRQRYLASLDSLAEGCRPLAEEMAESLLRLVTGDTVNFVTWLPIGGLRFASDPLQVRDVTVRRLTPQEMGALVGPQLEHSRRPRRHLQPTSFLHLSERWAIEFRSPCPKRPNVQPGDDHRTQRFVLALQLLGFEPHGAGEAATWTEPGPTLSEGGQTFRLPAKGQTNDCSSADLERALALIDRIPVTAVGGPSSPNEVALHRFLLGACEDVPPDALVDFVIAIEALLRPPDAAGELTFKLRLFGAHFLGQDAADRQAVFKDLKRVYDARSVLVHGKEHPTAGEIEKAARLARTLAARMLLKALETGWPTPKSLELAALGAAPGS